MIAPVDIVDMKLHPSAQPAFPPGTSRLWTAGLILAIAGARLAASAVPSTGTAALDAELHEILRTAGIRPALREDLQRPVDPRLVRIETLGPQASGLFPGRRHEVHNAREIEALSLKLKPGDQLVLRGSDWKDARFVFGGEGTAEAPILIQASPEASPISGRVKIAFFGRHLVISGLTLREGSVGEDNRDVVRLGLGPDRPAEHCIVHRLTIDGINSENPTDWPRLITRYLLVVGFDNTIANSEFVHLKNYGEVVSTLDHPAAELQSLHILDNRFIDRPRIDDDPCPYRYKIIQIGWHELLAAPAGSLIQGNYFEDCASHVELVSIKASDVFMRNNRFIRCQGAVNIRMGDRALIQNNFFDGEDRPDTGGLRVAGRDHVIIGNMFRRLRPAEFSHMRPPPAPPTRYLAWTLSLVAADFEYSGATDSAYGRVCDTLISHNRFEHNTGRIALGTPTPSLSSVSLSPRNVRIEHNIFAGYGAAETPFDHIGPNTPSETFLTYHNRFLP